MNFFFAKLFEEYEKKNDSPTVSIMYYMTVFYFFFFFSLFLPISEAINKVYFNNHLIYNKSVLIIGVFTVLATIMFVVYTIYIKNGSIFRLKEKHVNRKFNRTVLNLLVVMFPILFMLLGATITVIVKGGNILNHHFNGLI